MRGERGGGVVAARPRSPTRRKGPLANVTVVVVVVVWTWRVWLLEFQVWSRATREFRVWRSTAAAAAAAAINDRRQRRRMTNDKAALAVPRRAAPSWLAGTRRARSMG